MTEASLLVVEDEAIVALDLSMQLQEMGYRVVGTAESGERALQLAHAHRPHLVLMDVMLKGPMDGIEVAQQLGRGLQVPVVFLTSYSDAATVRRAAQTAPYGYLTKPFQAKELRAIIEVALSKATIERQLRDSERWFASALRCVGDGVIVTEPDGRVRFLNPAAEALTGWTLDQASGHPVDRVMGSGAVAGGSLAMRALGEGRVQGIEHAQALTRRDGAPLRVDVSAAPVQDEAGERLGAVVALRDASARLAQEERLRASEERFRSAFDFAPLGMALVSLEGRFIQVNEALCRFLGFAADELLALSHDSLGYPGELEQEHAVLNELLSGPLPVTQFEKRYRHRGGDRMLWSLVSVSVLRERDAPMCFLYQVHDMTERKQAESQLTQMAYFDPLTGLANRSRLRQELDRLMAFARRQSESLAVVYLDLDRFKQVNDRLGHEAGDQLLQEVARRLVACLRETDCVARLGGDEFVLLITGVCDRASVDAVLGKVHQALVQPAALTAGEVSVTPSLGVCLYPADGSEPDALLRHADEALYDAKAAGRDRYCFYGDAARHRRARP
jgi:diguanylate cyclase (GGDEF)-like protein/PAS domain S-box-containing protein